MKLFVFDMAGTTIYDKNHVGIALQNALNQFNYPFSIEEINVVMGFEKPVAIKELLQSKQINPAEEAIEAIHEYFVKEMIAYYETSSDVKPTENVLEIFDYLRAKDVKVGFDTGFSRPIADAIFKRLNWKAGIDFDFTITSDEVPHGRPYPDMIFKAMAQFGITDPEQVAKIGDTVSDLEQGMNARCGCVIGVTTGAYSRAELENAPHHHIIDNLIEIKNLL